VKSKGEKVMVRADKYYRPDEIAELLNVDKGTVYRLIRDIEDPLPALRLSKKGALRVAGRDLQEWMENHKVHPEDE
jgi:excisionase family DNA binding protein